MRTIDSSRKGRPQGKADTQTAHFVYLPNYAKYYVMNEW